MSDAPRADRDAKPDPRDPADVRLQTPEEHAAEIIDCWLEVGLLNYDRRLAGYRAALANDIRVAEARGALRARQAKP